MSFHVDTPQKMQLSELVLGLDIELIGADGSEVVTGCTGFETVSAGQLCYLSNPDYLENTAIAAGCFCIVSAEIYADFADYFATTVILIAQNPRRAFAQMAQKIYPLRPSSGQIHPTAIIDETAHIASDVEIGAFCVVGRHVTISSHSILASHVEISDGVHIAEHCRIASGVKISNSDIGHHVQIAENTVIGKRGFGFDGIGKDVQMMPHLGRVHIGNHVDIGSLCSIDRGVNASTLIDDYVMLDNQVHIAHNVHIGEGSILCAQTAIAGSSTIGKACMFGGKVGVADHVTIGDNAMVMGNANVTKSLAGHQSYAGFPAIPAQQFWRQQASVRALAKTKGRGPKS